MSNQESKTQNEVDSTDTDSTDSGQNMAQNHHHTQIDNQSHNGKY